MVPVFIEEPPDEPVEWRGHLDSGGSEAQKGRTIRGDRYLLAPERGDPGELLAVEENETAGDPVAEIEILAV